MVLNATFNNISAISWQSVLLVEETGVSGKNNRSATSHWQNFSHNVVSSTPRHDQDWNHSIKGDRHWLHMYIVTVTKDYFVCPYPDLHTFPVTVKCYCYSCPILLSFLYSFMILFNLLWSWIFSWNIYSCTSKNNQSIHLIVLLCTVKVA